jgi:uncharacterized protein YprB with RNaseH-like and TPR domain
MVSLRETKNHIKTTKTLAVRIQRGSLIDFETTGLPRNEGEHDVITLGYVYGNRLVIIQRKTREKKPFYREIRKTLQGLLRPFHSYNAQFERDVMEMELEMKVGSKDFVDTMQPWRKRSEQKGLKWPKLDELMSEPEDYLKESKVRGKDVPELWTIYLETGRETPLEVIMSHCLSDLLREMVLLIRYPL